MLKKCFRPKPKALDFLGVPGGNRTPDQRIRSALFTSRKRLYIRVLSKTASSFSGVFRVHWVSVWVSNFCPLHSKIIMHSVDKCSAAIDNFDPGIAGASLAPPYLFISSLLALY